MTHDSRLIHLALRLVPRRWRESVKQDLQEEAERTGRRGWAAILWTTARVLGIAFWIVGQTLADWRGGRPRWRRTADSLAADLRMALRTIARQPGSTAAIVFTLALGMSAATAAFAVFNHVLFRPVPGVGDPEGLATIYFQPADRHPTYSAAPRRALDALRTVAAFDGLGASTDAELPVVARPDAPAESVRVEFVTDRYLDVLRVRPRAGRLLTADDVSTRRSVAMISERWWHRAFGGDDSVVGRTITINRHPVVVVGILAGYRGWGAVRIGTIDIWLPIDAFIGDDAVSRDNVLNMIGRLRANATPAMAEAQLRGPFAPFASSVQLMMSMGRASNAPAVPVVYPGLHEAGQDLTRRDIARMYPFALGASGLLLLLACANTANLLLARTMKRRQDLAVRSALGADRWRLARGLLIEAAAIVLIAVGACLALARGFVSVLQGEQLFDSGPALDAVGIDWRVLVFAGALGAITVVLFGSIPALAAARSARSRALAQAGRTTRAAGRLRAGLVCVQLALALTLLAGAGVLVRSLQNLRGMDLGMNPTGVISFSVSPRHIGISGDRSDTLVRDLLGRLGRMAGVESVAFASPSPFWRGVIPVSLKAELADNAPEHNVTTTVVSADYFRTLQIPVQAGRTFTAAEFRRSGPKEGVGIVSESLARQLFGDGPAVGRHVFLSQAARGWRLDRTIAIVGVAGDTRSGANLRAPGRPALYEPAGANRGLSVFFVRSRLTPGDAVAAVRTAVRDVEPNLPIADAGALRDAVDRLIPEERVLALLIGGVALMALLLGLAGVHAVVAHTVAERTREFGIRLAIGASRRAVSLGVLRHVAVMAVIGLASGLALFAGASRLLESRVYGVSPTDPATLAAVAMLLAAAALAGAWLPARRATRVDPVTALRAE